MSEAGDGTPPARGAGAATSAPAEAHAAAVADRALRERPAFSIRLQVYLSALLLFVIAVAIALTTWAITGQVEREVHLFEVTSKIAFDIDQARRHEKNFFLHGTDLDDAVESAHSARRALQEGAERIRQLVGDRQYDDLAHLMRRYEELLEGQGGGPASQPEAIRRAETELRRLGRQLVTRAADLGELERGRVDRMMARARTTQTVLLAVLLAYIALMTSMLVRRIVGPIRRFMAYMERIAAGDYTPIMPRRAYRDEFSTLAMAINHMLRELERRQEILAESHKLRAVGTLTAGVAHELNNPMNNISLTASMLVEDWRDLGDEERLDMVRDIIGETQRSKKIVASLLDFARQSESKVQPFDLAHVAEETLTLVHNQLTLKAVRVATSLPENLPRIHGDPEQIKQVLLNLLLNAVEVTPRGGRLEVAVDWAVEPGFLAVRVRDFGPGIPGHVLPFIFDPFFTTKQKGKGTGLGLSICKGIAKKHDGDVTVETEVGTGTTFTLLLPVTPLPADLDVVKSKAAVE